MTDKTSDFLGALIDKAWPVGQFYQDAVQPAAKQIGKAGEDFVRAARLLTLPVQGIAMLQEKLDRIRARLDEQVPEARRVPILPRLGAPIIEGLRFAEDGELVTEYMLNLLAAAMDKDKVAEVHPAFPTIARDLAPDEAMILFLLKRHSYKISWSMEIIGSMDRPPGDPFFGPKVFDHNDFPLDQLAQPEHFSMFVDRLQILGVAEMPGIGRQERIPLDMNKPQVAVRNHGITQLTELGKLFARACVPDKLPIRLDHERPHSL